MKAHRILPLLVFTIACTCLMCSCSQPVKMRPDDILSEILSHVSQLNAGAIYRSGREEWEEGHLPQRLKEGLYVMPDGSLTFDESIDEFAIYLSSLQSGGEIAVFLCTDISHVEDVIRMCISRADLATELRPELENCKYIFSSGRYVVMVLLSDSELDVSDIRDALR